MKFNVRRNPQIKMEGHPFKQSQKLKLINLKGLEKVKINPKKIQVVTQITKFKGTFMVYLKGYGKRVFAVSRFNAA